MYFLLGMSLTLAFLLIVNMAAAILAAAGWRVMSRPVRNLSVNNRARVIFMLRIGPVAAALVFISAFVIPAYLLLEPQESGEVVSGKLAIIALVSSIAVCIAIYRVCKTGMVTRRLALNWQRNATRIAVDGVDVPVFRIVHTFPVMAVVGIIRPRIFIAEQVLEALGPDEFRAAIAHEYGHLRANDNFKRTILRVCRDLVILPVGTSLDRAWAESAESAADAYAASKGRSTALNLASALIKLARIAPKNTGPAVSLGSCLISEQSGDVTERVRRLVRISEETSPTRMPFLHGFQTASWVWSGALTLLLVLHLSDQRLLLTTHDAIEHFVRILQ